MNKAHVEKTTSDCSLELDPLALETRASMWPKRACHHAPSTPLTTAPAHTQFLARFVRHVSISWHSVSDLRPAHPRQCVFLMAGMSQATFTRVRVRQVASTMIMVASFVIQRVRLSVHICVCLCVSVRVSVSVYGCPPLQA